MSAFVGQCWAGKVYTALKLCVKRVLGTDDLAGKLELGSYLAF